MFPPHVSTRIQRFIRIENFWDIFEMMTFSFQNRVIWGGGKGSLRNMFSAILIFFILKSPCKMSEPYDNPFFGCSNGSKREKKFLLVRPALLSLLQWRRQFPRIKSEKIPKLVAYLSLLHWLYTLRSEQLFL